MKEFAWWVHSGVICSGVWAMSECCGLHAIHTTFLKCRYSAFDRFCTRIRCYHGRP